MIEANALEREIQRSGFHHFEPRLLEGAAHRARGGDVVIADSLEADGAEPCVHHAVDRRHAQEKLARWPQHTRDFGEPLLETMQVLEDRETSHEIERRLCIGKLVDIPLRELGGVPALSEERAHRIGKSVEVHSMKLTDHRG